MRFLIVLLVLLESTIALAGYPCLPAPGGFVRCLPANGFLLNNQQATRYSELAINGTDYVAIKAPASLTAPYTLTLPQDDGTANQLLQTDGSGLLSWVTGASTSLAQYNVSVGDSTNTATGANTNLIGYIKATTTTQTYAVTSATPGVFTITSHGFATGDKAYVTVTQNGFTANTTYYIHIIDANTFHLSTTLANATGAVYITSSGTTAGSIVSGGFVLTSGVNGTVTNDSATAGYVGEQLTQFREFSSPASITSTIVTNVTATPLTLTPGDWDVTADVCYDPAATTSVTSFGAGVSLTSATFPGSDTAGVPTDCEVRLTTAIAAVIPGDDIFCGPSITSFRCSVAVSTTKILYLVARTVFSISTNTVYGSIRARRVR